MYCFIWEISSAKSDIYHYKLSCAEAHNPGAVQVNLEWKGEQELAQLYYDGYWSSPI